MEYITSRINQNIENFCQDFFNIAAADMSVVSDETLRYYSFLDVYFQISMGIFAIKTVNYCISELSTLKLKDFLRLRKTSSDPQDVILETYFEDKAVGVFLPENILEEEDSSSSDDSSDEHNNEELVFEEIKI
jgi:hypothetical protein